MRHQENWYIVRDRQFSGPFSQKQIGQMLKSKTATYDDWIFTHGMDGWMQIKTISHFFLHNLEKEVATPVGDPRLQLMGQILMHNREELVMGSCVNVSRSGLFVVSSKKPFPVGTRLNVTLKSSQIVKPLNIWGKIVRSSNLSKEVGDGYGIQFDVFHQELEGQGLKVAA